MGSQELMLQIQLGHKLYLMWQRKKFMYVKNKPKMCMLDSFIGISSLLANNGDIVL